MTFKLSDKKINLHYGNQPKEGYENKDVRITPDISYSLEFEIPGSVKELIVNVGTLESTPKTEIKKYLANWNKSLSENGEIKVHFISPHILCNNFSYGRYPLEEFEKLMFHNKWQSIYDMTLISNLLIEAGFELKTLDYQDMIGIIHARKAK